jgi:hypothetical protein
VYGCNQTGELIDSDRVFYNITLDDMRDQAAIDLLRPVFQRVAERNPFCRCSL